MEKISIVISAAMATIAECAIYLVVFVMLCITMMCLLLPASKKMD